MADDIEYQNQRDLEIARSTALNSDTLSSQVGSAVKSVVVDKVKKSVGKIVLQALGAIAPFIGMFLLILLGVSVIIYVSCSTIPGASIFVDMCKSVDLSKEDKDAIKKSQNIDNAVNDICVEMGGAYNANGNDCGYGY